VQPFIHQMSNFFQGIKERSVTIIFCCFAHFQNLELKKKINENGVFQNPYQTKVEKNMAARH